MGLLNDLKKVFFGAEALSKSAINKGKEMAEASAEQISKDIADKTSGIKDAILESDVLAKASNSIDDLSGTISDKAKDFANQAEKTISDVQSSEAFNDIKKSASDLADKASEKVGDLSETIGTTVFGENNERLDKMKEMADDIGQKVNETKDKIVEQANEIKKDIDSKIDETLVKAQELEKKEQFEKTQRESTAPNSHGDSTLDGSDDFFSKAEKFAKGDYQVFSEGEMSVDKSKVTKVKNDSKAAGFKDLDGDGNELIDDAIVE